MDLSPVILLVAYLGMEEMLVFVGDLIEGRALRGVYIFWPICSVKHTPHLLRLRKITRILSNLLIT